MFNGRTTTHNLACAVKRLPDLTQRGLPQLDDLALVNEFLVLRVNLSKVAVL